MRTVEQNERTRTVENERTVEQKKIRYAINQFSVTL